MLKRLAIGSALGVGIFFLTTGLAAAGCGAPQLLECKLSAARFLPDDPMAVTPYDVDALVRRLQECQVQGDAGR